MHVNARRTYAPRSSHSIIRFQENMLFDRLEFKTYSTIRSGDGGRAQCAHNCNRRLHQSTKTKINKHTENRSEIVLHYLLIVEWMDVCTERNAWPRVFVCVGCRVCASKFKNDYVVKADKLHFSLVSLIREHNNIVDAWCIQHSVRSVRIVERVE